MMLTLIGFDVELTGKRVLCVGVATLDETGRHTTKNFPMHGVVLPDGDDLGDFTPDKWAWWKVHTGVLRAQHTREPGDNDAVWRAVRAHFDAATQAAVARGAKVRVVSDNPAVDCGIVSEHLKAAHGGDWSYAVDYLQLVPGGPRTHEFVVDARTPRWQRSRKVGILYYRPVRVHGIHIQRHIASHDALLALCEYMGYVMAYPAVEQ